jgi:HD-like signal output (HDOD) protein
MGTSVLTVFKDVPSELIDMNSFWQHSIACGIIARIISGYNHNTLTERFFVAGLLHDIGRLVIFQSQPDKAKDSLLYAKNNNCLLQETEKALIGFDHAQVGGVLFKEWKLPMVLEKAVRFHHSHQQSQLQLDTAIVHLSDFITNALNIGSSGEHLVPRLNMKAWEEVNVSTNTLSAAVKQAEHHVKETSEIFFQNG